MLNTLLESGSRNRGNQAFALASATVHGTLIVIAAFATAAGARAVRSYTQTAMAKKVRFRPPGLRPSTKVGALGPYRGRLGLAWVVAPIVAGLLILLAGYFVVFR